MNDPYVFGQIAATNSLSDIYVTGGRPLLALNLISFPKKGLPREILKRILEGGLSKIKEAGALLVGGHSVDDPEPKYGLAVVGIAHPEKIITTKGARAGDLLYLTKPLGTGILATAFKGGFFNEESPIYQKIIELMTELNKVPSELMLEVGLTTATDITGFGLIGHALEMASASEKKLIFYFKRIPYLKEALHFVKQGIIPEGDYDNLNYCETLVKFHPQIGAAEKFILADAQTSGGILLACPREKKEFFEKRAIEKGFYSLYLVGEVTEGPPSLEILP
ncbi:selenide, water dikinase [Caldimicrobium thiodismutans]|uniref:Selenide, water dikinase n=1 Tax=Caldimicrobium thiodismutans TaxID=1653476 RepID=A0A0U5B1B9_9BACT|nr:selenide, water dikinase [Caldimicrobium thiodismutans]